jgi:HEAT repeat protein
MDDLPGWTANALIPLLWPEPWLPDELAAEVIRRFGTRTDWQWSLPLKASFQSLARGLSPEEPRLDLVQTMLEHPHLGLDTVEIVGGHPLAAYLPLLEEILLREGNTGGEASDRKVLAAKALAAYLDDRAAEILLKGLGGTTSEKVRGACFEALDTIRRYQDEKERWAQRKSSQAARDVAIAELVPMLADPDANIRAQAARSMGALGAVEHLPALVRLLKDPVPEVRVAAQEAIDVLTRPDRPDEGD